MKYWLALLCVWAEPIVAQPVEVTGGMIEGRISDDGQARIYEGIPFAAPPVGDYRWREPQPVAPWSGVRKANVAAPACLQNDYQWNRPNYLFSAEDCLTLDVRTQAQTGDRLPVMVWIHGGSNRAGSGSGTVASRITAQGIVLVTIQYRLGIFGFLSHRGLAQEQGGASGNYGLMDQIAGLKWVQANIAKFGGDPDNVTIFGESAGSQDVSLLLAAPAARGLFHKAIMQSGTPGFGMPARPLAEALALGDQMDSFAGETGGVAALRKLSPQALLAADLSLKDPVLWGQDFLWLRPTIDGVVLPKEPEALLAEAPLRPVIIGSNRFEFGPAKGSVNLQTYASHWFGPATDQALRLYRAEEQGGDARLGHLEGRMETDVVFRCPANNLATKLSGLGWPVWRYEFDIGPDNGTSSGGLTSHSYEIAFIMDRKPLGPLASDVFLQDYWTSFAKSRPGAAPRMKAWARYQPRSKAYVLFDRSGMTSKTNLRQEHCSLVHAI